MTVIQLTVYESDDEGLAYLYVIVVLSISFYLTFQDPETSCKWLIVMILRFIGYVKLIYRGTQREYSSKPLIHSIVERILEGRGTGN